MPFFILLTSVSILFSSVSPASAATSSTLNFQGRLLTSSGALVSDGSYNIEYKLYDAASGGTTLWTESRTGANQVPVRDGYFSSYLGSVTPFGASINWDQELWLTMNVQGDGEMSPRFKLTAVPYAFRAGALVNSAGESKTADDFAQLSPTNAQAVNAAVAALRFNQSGSGGFIQFQNAGTDVFTVNNNGGATLGSNTTQGQINLQDGNGQQTTLQAGDSALDLTFTLPTTAGTSGQCLKTDGSGILNFADCGSGGGGAGLGSGQAFYAYDTAGNINISAGWTDINLDTEVVKDAAYTHGADGSEITISETGIYEITYNISTNVTVGNNRSLSEAKIQVNSGAGFVDVPGSIGQMYNRQAGSGTSNASVTLLRNFTAGDIVKLQARRVSGTDTVVTSPNSVGVVIKQSGSAGPSAETFVQNGNAFGVDAVLGTTDANGLEIITNNTIALAIDATGAATFNNGLSLVGNGLNLNNNAITNSGDITGAGALTLSSSSGQDLTLDSGSNVLYLADDTLRRAGTGTTTIDLLDSSADTLLSLTNSDGARVANLSVEGDITATTFTGNGAGLTALNASNLTTGTVVDGLLSSNVALLNGSQNFTGANTFTDNTAFSGGLTLGNSAAATAGNIRFNGTDFEGFDGTVWKSLTTGSGGTTGEFVNVIKKTDETITNSVVLQDDDELFFNVGALQTWSFDFVLQANANATPDFKFAVTAPAGSTCRVGFEDAEGATSNAQFGCGVSTGLVPGTSNNEVYRVVGTVTTAANAGEVRLQWSQNTANAAASIVRAGSFVRALEENGGSGGSGSGGLSFVQNGNDFGTTAILGTTSDDGLNIVTNGVNALTFTNTGDATFVNGLTASNGLEIVSGNITSAAGLSIVSGGGGDLSLSSDSGIINLLANTLRRTSAGTTTIDLVDSSDTLLYIGNSDAGAVANLEVEGSISGASIITNGNVSAGTLTGNGGGLIGLDGSNIAIGTIADARLSGNVALLDTAQTFSALKTFSEGVVLGNSVANEAGALRWTGSDFEGFDGTNWLSLTTPTSAPLLEGVLAFGTYNGVSGSAIDIDGATVTKNATGDYTVSFNTAASTANYTVLLTVDEPVADLDDVIAQVTSRSSAAFDVSIHEGDNGGTEGTRIDRTFNFVVFDSNAVAGGGGAGPSGLEFVQNGNAFGADAIIGTTDANGLRIITNNFNALDFTATGVATFGEAVTTTGTLTASNGVNITAGGLDLNATGVTNAGALAGVTTIDASGDISTTGSVSANTANTINGLSINGGSVSDITGYNQTSGNFAISGPGTFSTGTGIVNLNGAVNAASTLAVNTGLTINGTNTNVDSRFYVEGGITSGSGIVPGVGIIETFTFDADNDADEAEWTFEASSGTNGLNPANTSRAWSHDTNETASANGIGPTSGQGGDPDGYVYTEASAGTPNSYGDTFTMTYNTIVNASSNDWVLDFYWNQRGDDNTAVLNVQTNEGGAGWINRGTFGGGDQPSNAPQVWNFESIDLATLVSDPSTQIRFLVTFPPDPGGGATHWHNDFGLDTITVREPGAADTFAYGDNLIEAYNKSTTSDVDLLSLRSDVGSVGDVKFRVDSDGDVFSDGTNNISGGADIAEKYKNTDNAQPGDVVYFTDNRTVAKTSIEGQPALAGVVSTNAGIVLDASVEGVPVGLKGRLPTKISIANGTIRRGDYLTSGPNGTAVKAINSGTAIGIAMEQAEADGTIDVFVGLTYYVGSTGDALAVGGLTYVEDDVVIQPIVEAGQACEENCGYLRMATNMINEDSSLEDTIAINKTGEQGNIIALKRNGEAVFTVANTGALEIRSSSSTALDIRNVGGTSFFSVDTITGITTAANITITGSFNGAGLSECSGEYESLKWSNGLFSCRNNAPKVIQIAQAEVSSNINNIAAQAIVFDTEVKKTSGYSHVQSHKSRVMVESPGWYRVDYGIGTQKQALEMNQSLKCYAKINATNAVSRSESYSINRSETSLEMNNSMSFLVEVTEANSYVEIFCEKNGEEGQIITVADKSWLLIEKR